MIGKVLDQRYRIEEPLGQGGIGRVYTARHLVLGRRVALKVLLAQYESVPVLQERFRREAEALASLSHPNIVTVTDFGVTEGMPYIVMELLEGMDLATLLYREVLEPKRALAITRQVLRALAYAHSRELVHRDLKPHNVFVRALGDGTDHVEVLDFGLARFMGEAASRAPKLTRAGALIGTPAYMAPEQASGQPVDARADVYAAGILLFETLTGRKPFESNDPGEILRAHLLSAPPRLAEADAGLQVSPGLEAWVARSLEKSPAARFAGAAEMLEALDALGADAVVRVGERRSVVEGRVTEPTQIGVTRAASPAARPAPGSEASIALPKRKAPLVIAAACVFVLVLSVGAALTFWWVTRSDDEPAPEVPAELSTVEPEPAEVVAVPAPARPSARDPFSEEKLPNELEAAAARIFAGRELQQSDYGTLSRYNRDHPDDVRGPLLLAHGHMNRRSLSLALPLYQEVLAGDPTVRGDPRILPALLELVRANSTAFNVPSATLIVDVYGVDALPSIDAQLAERLRPDEQERLSALRTRIRALPR